MEQGGIGQQEEQMMVDVAFAILVGSGSTHRKSSSSDSRNSRNWSMTAAGLLFSRDSGSGSRSSSSSKRSRTAGPTARTDHPP